MSIKNFLLKFDGILIAFVYFGSLTFLIFHLFTEVSKLLEVLLASFLGGGVASVLLIILNLVMKQENNRFKIARCLRAMAMALLIYGFVMLPLLSLHDAGFRNFSQAVHDMVYSYNAVNMLESAICAGVFSVIAMVLWRDKWTRLFMGLAILFAFPYLIGEIPLFYK